MNKKQKKAIKQAEKHMKATRKSLKKTMRNTLQSRLALEMRRRILTEDILQELVALKAAKDHMELTEEYQRRQPLAWKRAFELCGKVYQPPKAPEGPIVRGVEHVGDAAYFGPVEPDVRCGQSISVKVPRVGQPPKKEHY